MHLHGDKGGAGSPMVERKLAWVITAVLPMPGGPSSSSGLCADSAAKMLAMFLIRVEVTAQNIRGTTKSSLTSAPSGMAVPSLAATWVYLSWRLWPCCARMNGVCRNKSASQGSPNMLPTQAGVLLVPKILGYASEILACAAV